MKLDFIDKKIYLSSGYPKKLLKVLPTYQQYINMCCLLMVDNVWKAFFAYIL